MSEGSESSVKKENGGQPPIPSFTDEQLSQPSDPDINVESKKLLAKECKPYRRKNVISFKKSKEERSYNDKFTPEDFSRRPDGSSEVSKNIR